MATAFNRFAALGLGALTLAACAPFGAEQTHGAFDAAPAFGEAVKYNAAVQTINPDPVYAPGSQDAGTNGDAARAAAERYRKGAVKPIERPSTTETISGSGGGGGR